MPGTRLKRGRALTVPAFWPGSQYTENGSHLEDYIESTTKHSDQGS
jgi:hypothetical protein